MAENTGIEWADHTLNFWLGCTKVSPACDNCYAERDWDQRFKRVKWGPHADRSPTKNNLQKAEAMDRKAKAAGEIHKVFVNSLSDTFDNHKSIDPAWREDIWEAARRCQNLCFLLLTKRPQNIRKMLPSDWGDGYPNVWLGTTVENQREAERRIPHLLRIPAALHFLSCEPLIEPVDLQCVAGESEEEDGYLDVFWDAFSGLAYDDMGEELSIRYALDFGVAWVITGGESGPNFRDIEDNAYRSLRDQCEDAGVPFHFKQRSGANKQAIKTKGRLLDGVEHNGCPLEMNND